MPSSSRSIELCRYHYDPLDRQNGCRVLQQPTIQHFHNKNRLTTEIQGATHWSFLQHDEQLLAQQMHLDVPTTTLLATDQQRSVLNALDALRPHPLAYMPYGHRPAENGLLSLLGFNGERPDPVTGHYHLGNGYRQFNPVLMRFNSPDSWSPFGEGGVNSYAYCSGDPVTKVDKTGHFGRAIAAIFFVAAGIGSVAGGIEILKKDNKTTLDYIGAAALISLGLFLVGTGLSVPRSSAIARRQELVAATNSVQPRTRLNGGRINSQLPSQYNENVHFRPSSTVNINPGSTSELPGKLKKIRS
ncbi:hypothetical protein C1886_09495 [Pseudomonas sp. FW300-N1A1]|uniref:RHS repeat-associated core domain-containing protein n=1 Tax=Pseudomonas sp. FW300-N1A1 TaxID=2075555 RepID=UPI000CD29F00|nr:RHS repeat-associated core domain-containing protein [Pseudomonas sp. FW300-N1A1]POA20265.1 hypothetical protein C1886_09495 [Pseudomonas sp. FW300-N1A1]